MYQGCPYFGKICKNTESRTFSEQAMVTELQAKARHLLTSLWLVGDTTFRSEVRELQLDSRELRILVQESLALGPVLGLFGRLRA